MNDPFTHPEMPGYASVKEASRMLGVSIKRVHMFIDEGRLPAVWAGNSLMIKLEDLHSFERKASGRTRKLQPVWRLSTGKNTQHITSISVQVFPGQEEPMKKMLEQIKRNRKHLFRGTIARYFSQSERNISQIEIILIWRGSIMPDEATREKELAAFRQSFAGVLNWSTAHYENYYALMHT